MTMTIAPRLHRIVAAQPYPLLFATISGAHLYGFPSPDSDYDLRGAQVLPLDSVVGLEVRDETVQDERVLDGLEMDIVSEQGGAAAPALPIFGRAELPLSPLQSLWRTNQPTGTLANAGACGVAIVPLLTFVRPDD